MSSWWRRRRADWPSEVELRRSVELGRLMQELVRQPGWRAYQAEIERLGRLEYAVFEAADVDAMTGKRAVAVKEHVRGMKRAVRVAEQLLERARQAQARLERGEFRG